MVVRLRPERTGVLMPPDRAIDIGVGDGYADPDVLGGVTEDLWADDLLGQVMDLRVAEQLEHRQLALLVDLQPAALGGSRQLCRDPGETAIVRLVGVS